MRPIGARRNRRPTSRVFCAARRPIFRWRGSRTNRSGAWRVRRPFGRRLAGWFGCAGYGRRCLDVGVELDAEDGAELVFGEVVAAGRAARERRGGACLDQLGGVDAAQPKQQFRLRIEPVTDAVEGGGDVLAHGGPVRTVAGKFHFAGFREQAAVTVADDTHDLLGEPSLQQFQQ